MKDICEYVSLGSGGNLCVFPTFGSFFSAIVWFALIASGFIFVLMIVWGGFRYLSAGGDQKAADSARQTISSAVIGLLIVAKMHGFYFWMN